MKWSALLILLNVVVSNIAYGCGESGGGSLTDSSGSPSFGTSLHSSVSFLNFGTGESDCNEYVLPPEETFNSLSKNYVVDTEQASIDSLASVTNFTFTANYNISSEANGFTFVHIEGDVGDALTLQGEIETSTVTFELCYVKNGAASAQAVIVGAGISPLNLVPEVGSNEGCVTQTLTIGTETLTIQPVLSGLVSASSGSGYIEAHLSLSSLSVGTYCFSASEAFPGCDGSPPVDPPDPPEESTLIENKQPAQCPSTPHPINLALGFKHNTQIDYQGGLLSFVRHYRSDADWFTEQMGQRWRHNFERQVEVTPTLATVTNADGLVYHFAPDGEGNWVPTAEDAHVTDSIIIVGEEEPETSFIYVTDDDTREYYNQNGQLVRLQYLVGESLYLSYNDNDQLAQVRDESGRTLAFFYNDAGRLDHITTPDGDFAYGYDPAGNLTEVTRPDTTAIEYHYEDSNFPHALTGITDALNVRAETYLYDAQGRAISSELAGGSERTLVFYNEDKSTTTVNPLGKLTTYYFDTILGVRRLVKVEGHASEHCAAANQAYSYTQKGFIGTATDWEGNITAYEYDDRGLVTKKREALGTELERVTRYVYETEFRLPNLIYEGERTTNYSYDDHGRITRLSVFNLDESEKRVITYEYYPDSTDADGNTVLGRLASVDGSRTDVEDITTYHYDAQHRLIDTENALGQHEKIRSFDASNRPTLIEDANKIRTRLVYDALGRLKKVVAGSNTESKAITRTIYDNKGRITKTIAPDGSTLRYVYDDADRLTKIRNSDDITIYTLDEAGNRTKEIIKDSENTLRYRHKTVFDELSRPIRDIDDNDDKIHYAYDLNGQLVRTIDGNDYKTRFIYDGLLRQIREVDALDGKTKTSYDRDDQPTKITDPRENATRYIYNTFGEVIRQISPDSGKTLYFYDEAGNLIRSKDARGTVTRYKYDALNRLTKTIYPSDHALDVTYIYDEGDICTYGIGRVCRISDASGITDYAYDALGRVITVRENRDSLTFTTHYAYDLAGNIISITLPSGRLINYIRNADAEIVQVNAFVNDVEQSLASDLNYLPFGSVTGLTYGNGITLTNLYNTAYQLTSRTIGSVMEETYLYDHAGHITATSSTTYAYDPLYRLKDESGLNGSLHYSYDAIGNRLTEEQGETTKTYIYPEENSRLQAVDGTSLTYDDAGNITNDGTRSYVINAAGDLASISLADTQTGSYAYDASHLRTQKTTASGTTYYVHGQGGMLYGEYKADGTPVREYVYLHGEPLAQINSNAPSPLTDNVLYLYTDHLGTPRYGTDAGGTQVWSWNADAFGQTVASGTQEVNLRFAGQYYDSESGLHYNWHRYYDSALGRYITSDPIGLEGGLNTYAYAGANPVMAIDPEGLVCVTCQATNSGGIDYKDGVKQCRYKCSSDDGREAFIEGPGEDLSKGDVCYGANYREKYFPHSGDFTNVTTSLNPFEIDTESFWDNFKYPDELIEKINNAFPTERK